MLTLYTQVLQLASSEHTAVETLDVELLQEDLSVTQQSDAAARIKTRNTVTFLHLKKPPLHSQGLILSMVSIPKYLRRKTE